MDHTLTWLINTDDGMANVALSGVINEEADLQQITKNLEGHEHVRLDLAGIHRINSSGIREWMHFIGPFTEAREVELVRCSPAMVAQLNVFRDFAGTARVLSYQAPYLCPDCDAQKYLDVEVEQEEPTPETLPCTSCEGEMEFDDVPECYFAFLRWHGEQK